MLSYQDLRTSQKRWVDLVELHFPERISSGTLKFSDIKEIHEFFVSKRAEHPNYKCSMPLWLITHNAISRGVYQFPGTNVTIAEPEKTSNPLEEMYIQSLQEFGIKPKKQ